MPKSARIQCAGEAALIVYLGTESSPEVAARVQALGDALRRSLGNILVELIPSYASLLVLFDPLRTDRYHVSQCIRNCLSDLTTVVASSGRVVEIPVYYSSESGEDLENLASSKGLSIQEVIDIHSEQEYRVYAIGFAPGFAYLGDVDTRIAAPRLSTPRQSVPRGAVAIADRQTAVYPASSPGGWNLIGRSPLKMFDPLAEEPMPVHVGDRVRFTPIDRSAFIAAGGDL
ncbi:MAG: KipI family sensor histidine kinase inhibitor [Glaciecola sp.]|jgi:KipI family sensor histidine kinase inhibitor|uniref:5-oxoprolinase subunit PxpB n=1 Tax=Congregibacter sp. TaxID=2744308 RepID=UPI0039E42E38